MSLITKHDELPFLFDSHIWTCLQLRRCSRTKLIRKRTHRQSETALMVNVGTYLGVPLANQIFVLSNWSSLRYYHSIFCSSRLLGFPPSSSAGRHRSPRNGTRIVLCFVRGCKTVTFWSIYHSQRIDTKTVETCFVCLFRFGWNRTPPMFQRPCPPVGCAAEWYSVGTDNVEAVKMSTWKWNGYNFSNTEETE